MSTDDVGPTEVGSATTPAAQMTDLAAQVAKLTDDFGEVIPHLVGALRRDRSVDELVQRLAKAEERLAARGAQPLALGIMRLLHSVRRLDMPADVKAYAQVEFLELLSAHGYTEFGAAGQPYDSGLHEAVEGRTIAGRGVLSAVHATGFRFGTDVVLKAKVDVAPFVSPPETAPEDVRA